MAKDYSHFQHLTPGNDQKSLHLLRPDIGFFGTIRLSKYPGKYLCLSVWTNNHKSYALNVVINPYKLALLYRDKAFLDKSIQAYSRHCTLKSIVYTRLTAAYRNMGTQ